MTSFFSHCINVDKYADAAETAAQFETQRRTSLTAKVTSVQQALGKELIECMSEVIACGPASAAQQVLSDFCAVTTSLPYQPDVEHVMWTQPTVNPVAAPANSNIGALASWSPIKPAGIWGQADIQPSSSKPSNAWELLSAKVPAINTGNANQIDSLIDGATRTLSDSRLSLPSSLGVADKSPGTHSTAVKARGDDARRGTSNIDAGHSASDDAGMSRRELVAFEGYESDTSAFDILLEDGMDATSNDIGDAHRSDSEVDESWLFAELDVECEDTSADKLREIGPTETVGTLGTEHDDVAAVSVAALLMACMHDAAPTWFANTLQQQSVQAAMPSQHPSMLQAHSDIVSTLGDLSTSNEESQSVRGVSTKEWVLQEPDVGGSWSGEDAVQLCLAELQRQLLVFLWMNDHLLGPDLAGLCTMFLSREDADQVLTAVTQGHTLPKALAAIQV